MFSHFIPCGVWEAVYLLQGLLDNTSEVQPATVHTDTQGQSLPVFGLAWAPGFELLPRIRNWQDLVFFGRPTVRYQHIDKLFADEAADWALIENHWPDIMRVVLSIRAGRISSAALLAGWATSPAATASTGPSASSAGRSARSCCCATYPSPSCARASPPSPTGSRPSTGSPGG